MLTGIFPSLADQAMPLERDEATTCDTVTLTPTGLFEFADRARDNRDFATAEAAYRALAANPDPELRTEAQFRLAMMFADLLKRYAEAAVLLRKILDEKPNAARVRLELARMDALLGHGEAARRELRAAAAAGLPPEVDRMVRFYASALYATKPAGGSMEISIAPDTNINRATRSATLGTVIGDFTLDPGARAMSGTGIALRGQAYLRQHLFRGSSLLVRLSGNAALYREASVDDGIVSLQAGPEFLAGQDRYGISVGPSWRWYGLKPYSYSLAGSAYWQHPLGSRAQIRVEGGFSSVANRRNALQTSYSYILSISYDRAFSARLGGGVQVSGDREVARDAGYSTASGNIALYSYLELGETTLVASLGYGRLEADARLFLYPRRRMEDRFSTGISVTPRSLRVGAFAPILRLHWERNRSTIELFDYRRLSGEIGITAAF